MKHHPTAVVVALGGALLSFVAGCDRLEALRGARRGDANATPPVDSAEVAVPPVLATGVPLAAFADAAVDPSTGTPYEQAVAYESSGQLWHARLVLETQALGADATARETELLAKVCAAQGDTDCLARCEQRLGRKLKLDAGAAGRVFDPARTIDDGTSDAAKAQRLVLKGDPEAARKLLQPKLVGKTISADELRVLRMACERQRDTMCVLACDGMMKEK